MSVAVEQRKQGDDDAAQPHRQFHSRGDQYAEHQHRQNNAMLNERQRYARNTHRTADRHHTDEGQRHDPERLAAHLRRPQADGDHRAQMIQARQGVNKAVRKSARPADTGMRLNQTGNRQNGSNRKQSAESNGERC